jgi:4-amino-4-deoxy-L-arabinose transferase-like glycosyltransferase
VPGAPPSLPRGLAVLLLAAGLLFTANAETLSLPALDDCFYARKGVEMARGGLGFTVTFNGEPNFQNPPLPFWILGTGFRVLGENDFAARLP